MTDAQRKALQDYLLLTQASAALDRAAELEYLRVPVNHPRADAIEATAADVYHEAEDALGAVLKSFGV